jgi:hypothetical protein
MTKEHRMAHHCVIKELPSVGEPLSPELTAKELDLSQVRATAILDDLEMSKIVVRNNDGEVVWAYPVTVEATPDRGVWCL